MIRIASWIFAVCLLHRAAGAAPVNMGEPQGESPHGKILSPPTSATDPPQRPASVTSSPEPSAAPAVSIPAPHANRPLLAAASTASAAPAPPPPPPLLQRAAWVLLGVTATAGVGGVVFGLGARSRANEVERRLKLLDSTTNQPAPLSSSAAAQLQKLERDGRIWDGLSIAFYATAGAAAVATGVLFGLGFRGPRERPSVAKPATPVAVVPSIGPRSAALSAVWEF